MTSHRMLRFGALAAALLAGSLPARADMQLKDGTGALQSVCTTTFGSPTKHAYCHYLVDINGTAFGTAANPLHATLNFGGTDLTLGQATAAKSLPVVLPSNPDILNAAATLTAADAASTTAAGQNGVSVVSGTPTPGSVYSVAVNGQSEADFVIGAFTGTLVFEGSANGGLTWTPRSAHVMGTKYRQTQVTGPGVFHINAAGLTNIRVRVIALTSGTPSVQLNTTTGTGSVYVMNDVELVDNATGLSPSTKAGGAAALTDPAMTVQNPNEAQLLTALNTAFGACSEAAWTGTGTPTLCAVMKAIYGQAPASGAAGSAPPNGASIGYVQLVPGAQPQPVTGTVTTQSGTALASPAYRIASAAAGSNAQVFATGARRMLHAYFCNKATSDRVLKFYDKASAPVPGTDAIVTSIGAPAGSCPVIDFSSGGFPFANGLAIAITLPGDSDTGSSVAAGDVTGLNIQHN